MQLCCVWRPGSYPAFVAPKEAEDAWADAAATWDDDPLVQAYAQAALHTLLETCAREDVALADARVLDFGCGTARIGRALAERGASVVAFDISPAMLDQLRARLPVDGPGAVEAVSVLTPEHVGFDLVVASSALGFVPDLDHSVNDLAGRLKAGGLLVQWDWESAPGDGHGLTRSAITQAYVAAGLDLISLETGFEVEAPDLTMAPLMGVARRPLVDLR